MVFKVVLLPAPLRPSSATTSRFANLQTDIEQDVGVAVEAVDPVDFKHRHVARRPRDRPRDPRVPPDLVGVALGQKAAFVQHHDASRHCEDRIHIMLDQHDCAAGAQALNQLGDFMTLGWRETGERLVEQQYRGKRGQRQPQFEAALFAVGERVRPESRHCRGGRVRRARPQSPAPPQRCCRPLEKCRGEVRRVVARAQRSANFAAPTIRETAG